jgi:hypothetical protein
VPSTRTVSVRIAVAIDPDGNWNASGWGKLGNDPSKNDKEAMGIAVEILAEGESRFFFTAELPVPDVNRDTPEIPATVEPV